MKNYILLITSLLFVAGSLSAQMVVDGTTLYGNEWIDYSKEHFKFEVGANGLYRIPKSALPAAMNNVQGDNFQLFVKGQEIPIYVSTSGLLGNNDYIEFRGDKNIGDVDTHLYGNPDHQVNKEYSLISDTISYFLTWNNSTSNVRYDQVSNNLTNLPAAEPYWLSTSKAVGTSKFSKGAYVNPELYDSKYNLGEGYSTSFGTSKSVTLQTRNIYPGVATSTLISRVSSSSGAHEFELQIDGQGTIESNTFSGFAVNEYVTTINNSMLSNATKVFTKGLLSSADQHAIATMILIYPREFNFNNASGVEFKVLGDANNRKYLEIQNFNHGGTAPVLYDRTNNIRIVTELDGGVVKVALPPSSEDRDLLLYSMGTSSPVKFITSVEEVNFIDYSDAANQGDYLMISHAKFINDPLGYLQDYASYRSSTGLNPVIIDVQQLYDQFAYGIKRHPISIRNFAGFADTSWPEVKYMFIIGNGRGYQSIRKNVAQPIYVPTFGQPQADNLLTATVDSNVPRIPIGRLPVLETEQIDLYLTKVKAYEGNQNTLAQTLEDKGWMKRIMHLGGGDPGIQAIIQANLNSYKNVISQEQFGGDVTSFFKTSTDPIQISQSEFLDSLINTGVSMITFFGHSSSNSFDFSLDIPESYENFERYPVMLSLGCFSGQIHSATPNLGEEFVFAEDKGAIAFLASVSLSGLNSLHTFATRFYDNLTNDYYEDGLGTLVQVSIDDLSNYSSIVQLINQQMTLNGDPAIKLNTHATPDYLVNGESVAFSPSEITINDDFVLDFDVVNIGRAISDSFHIKIVRTLPNGNEIEIVNELLPTPYYTRSYSFDVTKIAESVGNNIFTINIDAEDLIIEGPAPQGENNNTYVVNQFIFTDDINPVYPYEFSIVSTPGPTLKASISNVFAEDLLYYIEIDTTEEFNSPIKKTNFTTVPGGVLEWQPDIPYYDNTVYYWRVQVDPNVVQNSTGWKGSSFIYLDGSSPGWNQSHYFQFLKDRFVNIELPANREFKFIDDFKEIRIRAAMSAAIDGDLSHIAFSINNYLLHQSRGGISLQGLNFVVLDPITVEPWINEKQSGNTGLFNSIIIRNIDYPFFYRTNNTAGREAAIDFIEQNVPDGHYVLIFSADDFAPDDWGNDTRNLFDVLQTELGATLIQNTVNDLRPYGALLKKNDPTYTPMEVLGDSLLALLDHKFTINGNWDSGNILSTTIGPALSWETATWTKSDLDGLPINDVAEIEILGIDNDGVETTLIPSTTNPSIALNGIDAAQYPNLRLKFNSQDQIDKTTAQLDYWRINYVEFPDCALRPDVRFTLKDTVQQGEPQNFEIAIENLSKTDMEPLLFRYSIVDENNNIIESDSRLAALPALDTIFASFTIDTRNLEGTNKLILEANPENDQPEQFLFNNIGLTKFFVQKDIRNPILDVTFDGQHIMDGDIVSAKPSILVTLNDENKYLELGDTSLIEVRMLRPGEALPAKPVYFSSSELVFTPADPNNLVSENKATVEYTPTFNVDGEYQLFVLARDPSRNESGDLDYKVSFNVINKASISNMLNYPNPFTTSTQFVFTLTGSELPTSMKIQIMTVTGKVVREITMDELGPLHIGNNRTEYAWDGTDEFGDKLANGVYLYRVVTQGGGGNSYERYQTNTNQYFKSGFGKMYLMR